MLGTRFAICLILAASVCPSSFSQAGKPQESPAPEVLTLDHALVVAHENNREIKIASIDVTKAKDELSISKTNYFPEFSTDVLESLSLTPFSFTVPAGSLGTFAATGPIPAENTEFKTPRHINSIVRASATQPLSQIYRIRLGVQGAQAGVALQQEMYRGKWHDIEDRIRRTYYTLVETQSQLQAAQESIKALQEMDRITANYVEQKAALKYQSLEVKARLAQAQLDATTLEDALANQRESMNDLLARNIDTEFAVQETSPPTEEETTLAEARAEALEMRPEVREAQLKVEQADLDARAQKSYYYPDVSLSLNYLSPFNVNFVPKNIVGAGLLFSWDPFDWGKRKHELDEKRQTVSQAQTTLEQTKSQVTMDVDSTYRKLREARAAVTVKDLTRQAQEEKLRVMTEEYKQDATLLSNLLQQQTDYERAESDYQHALSSFWTAKADFERALGED